MTTDLGGLAGPADTSMMPIVHNALLRDFGRAEIALSESPYPDAAQREALSAHLLWMLGFLHHHHESEDLYLYPMVRSENPAAGELLDAMNAEHREIQPAIEAATAAVEHYAASAAGREQLLTALSALDAVLRPHLRREEADTMPVVSASITNQQWADWEQTHNVDPLTLSEKAFTGNWFLDDLDDEGVQIVSALVPPIPRWLIKHVLVRGYRKAMFRCWRLPQHSSLKIKLSGEASQHVDAAPEAVWQIVSDVTRTGEWSHECHTAEWIDGASRAATGARFRGRSRSGISTWSRTCTVETCAPPSAFSYRTEGRLFQDATEWLFTMEPEGSGTRLTQRYRVRALAPWADRMLWLVLSAHHDRGPALAQDLARLAALAELEPRGHVRLDDDGSRRRELSADYDLQK